MVTPTPDGNDTVMELLLLRSIKVDDIVTLLPTKVKLSEISVSLNFTINDPVLKLALTCSQKINSGHIIMYIRIL